MSVVIYSLCCALTLFCKITADPHEWKPVKTLHVASVFFLVLIVASCTGSDPGALAGNWQAAGILPMKVTYRAGEEEAMGIITNVSYETRGKDVIVSYKDGMMKGTSIRYTMVNADTARSELVTLVRRK